MGAKYVASFAGDAAAMDRASALVREAYGTVVQAQLELASVQKAAALMATALGESGAKQASDMTAATVSVEQAFDYAVKTHNEAMQKEIAAVILGSTGLKDALVLGGNLTAEGFEALSKLVEGSSKAFAEDLRKRASDKAGSSVKAPPPTINMTGGQTFKIQQDFRDQDPDRVAYVFEEQIGRLVTQRVGSNTSTPFGT
jgi:hypothetical protein